MPVDLVRAGARIAVLILGLALVTLPFQPAGSAEFVVTVLAAIVGAAFAIGIAVVARVSAPPMPDDKPHRKIYNGRSIER